MRRTLTLTAVCLLTLGLAACNPTATTAGSSDAASSNPTSGPSTHSVVGSNGGVAAAPTTKAAAPAGPLLKVSGNGINNTKQFTTGDSWNLAYTYDCTSFGQAGNFAVTDESGMPLVNELKLKGSGSSPQYNAGTHHLEINSECDWTITVTNG
jgi:hypothetical protein